MISWMFPYYRWVNDLVPWPIPLPVPSNSRPNVITLSAAATACTQGGQPLQLRQLLLRVSCLAQTDGKIWIQVASGTGRVVSVCLREFLLYMSHTLWLWLTVRHGIDGPFIDGLPIKMVIFHGYVSHNQMVTIWWFLVAKDWPTASPSHLAWALMIWGGCDWMVNHPVQPPGTPRFDDFYGHEMPWT